ncbi:NAD(P)-dependent oxidoreductase [Alloiococcus sp. CFN-8]|uniref:NAD(P)-dependent oxidoreductase n=1 Tax=Alloiococcus sp. CFN-8 TaxID=3416081 RepID=UPI003CFA66A0
MKRIAFIGVGVMGTGMVRNLMKNGYEVNIYSRTKSKAEKLITEGAVWKDSIAECIQGREVIITIVGYPQDVEEVYFGEDGIIKNADKGSFLIDMTTTSPELSIAIYKEAKDRALKALDAPVSGGDVGANNGTLAIMVGGEEEAFQACVPIFQALGNNIVYQGGPGAGQHTKMANQIAIAGAVAGVCEAITYAMGAGLDVERLIETIGKGAAGSWQLTNIGPKMYKEDYAPGFYLKHFIKDMKIAQGESLRFNKELPVLGTVLDIYKALEEKGFGDLGTQGIIKHYKG